MLPINQIEHSQLKKNTDEGIRNNLRRQNLGPVYNGKISNYFTIIIVIDLLRENLRIIKGKVVPVLNWLSTMP
jgi:hypothetical protein